MVTDAAMSGCAECVMLKKGPHILLALDFLATSWPTEGHQTKKSALVRKLSVAEVARELAVLKPSTQECVDTDFGARLLSS